MNSDAHSLVIPVIETPRLRLRGQRLEDFKPISEMWAMPDVYRYIDGKPRSEEVSWMKFLRNTGHWALMGFGYWVVEEKSSGAFVGEVGLAEFKREMTPSIFGEPDAGWAITPAAGGKGYATEAITAALDWAAANLTNQSVYCIIGAANAPSIRVAEKAGFERVTRTFYHGDPIYLFRRPLKLRRAL